MHGHYLAKATGACADHVSEEVHPYVVKDEDPGSSLSGPASVTAPSNHLELMHELMQVSWTLRWQFGIGQSMGHVRLVYGDAARPFTWRFLTVQVLEQFGIVV